MATGVVTVAITATLILPANERRQSFYLFNNGLSAIYMGETNAVTVATGFPLAQGSQISEDRGQNQWKGDIWGIVAAGTEEIRFWQRTHSA
jgi:hypothetical protein